LTARRRAVVSIERREYPSRISRERLLHQRSRWPLVPPPFEAPATYRGDADRANSTGLTRRCWSVFARFGSGGSLCPAAGEAHDHSSRAYDGGAEWGRTAFDPRATRLYVNANEMALGSAIWLRKAAERTDERQETSICSSGLGLPRTNIARHAAGVSLVGWAREAPFRVGRLVTDLRK